MRILGIDYGLVKVGLAIAEGPLAEPLQVIRYEDIKELVGRLQIEIEKHKIEKIVIGVSEGVIAKESKRLASLIINHKSLIIDFSDETLSTHEAQELAKQSGMTRKKRRGMEDAFAATIMLQNYLDSQS